MDTVWIVLIVIVGVAVLVAMMRWLLAGGRRRDPGRVVPESEEPPRR